MWRCGLNVQPAHRERRKRQRAGILQFTLQSWSGWQAACADSIQVASGQSGCGFHPHPLAEVGAWGLLAGVAAGADGQADGGHQRDEQRRPEQGGLETIYRQRERAGGAGQGGSDLPAGGDGAVGGRAHQQLGEGVGQLEARHARTRCGRAHPKDLDIEGRHPAVEDIPREVENHVREANRQHRGALKQLVREGSRRLRLGLARRLGLGLRLVADYYFLELLYMAFLRTTTFQDALKATA